MVEVSKTFSTSLSIDIGMELKYLDIWFFPLFGVYS